MSQVSAVDNVQMNYPSAYFNAVKIQINEPQANIPNERNNDLNGEFNAVNIQLNKPSMALNKSGVYDYPEAEEIVTYDKTYLPSGTKTDTYVNDEVIVPEPYITTVEDEKKNLTFHSHKVNFRANQIIGNIVAAQDIKSKVDIDGVVNNLKSTDYDKQAIQIEEIVSSVLSDETNALPYINKRVFSQLASIVKMDTSNLAGPAQDQIELRNKFILNEIAREEAINDGKDAKEIELPYTLSQQDLEKAMQLSPLEQAERNKEYGMLAIAVLTKNYVNEYKKQTGNTVLFLDLPAISEIVNSLKYEKNPSVRITAIDALSYIQRPEYKKELTAIYKIVANDKNPAVAQRALLALADLEELK
ncbi:MAG: hypothetical protein MJ237_02265 [bacterium]|nr:hypothetical protein [bacterium]